LRRIFFLLQLAAKETQQGNTNPTSFFVKHATERPPGRGVGGAAPDTENHGRKRNQISPHQGSVADLDPAVVPLQKCNGTTAGLGYLEVG